HTHSDKRGFGHLGQPLGVGIGTGSNVQTLEISMVEDWKKVGILFERLENNKDFYCNYEERAKKSQRTTYLIEIARENCLDGDKVRAGDMVNFSIGQGDVLMTPIQMAVMY
ncbi:MAG: hypothetical protein ACK55I_05375, partial [bacterium]